MTFTLGQVVLVFIALLQLPRALTALDSFCYHGNCSKGSIIDPLAIAVLCVALAFN